MEERNELVSNEELKGKIEVEYRVICGRCRYWEYLDGVNKREMKRWAKKGGWIETDYWGWLCPDCINEFLRREEEEENTENNT